ncbi:MAG: sulfotransferase [Halioglobus sp.]
MNPSTLPPQAAVIRLANRLGDALAGAGYAWPTLQVDSLLSAAERRTGLDHWGDESVFEGLRVLVTALEGQAELTPVGRVAAYLNLLDHLCVRLRLLDYRERRPQVQAQRVRQPLFILGLPRTGTTILHELIAQDGAMRSPASWEVARPLPPPAAERYASDARIAPTQRMLGLLKWLVPGFQAIHAVGARLPQECVYMLASAGMSEQFSYMYNVPDYRDWLLEQDMTSAYRWHRHFLQHLQVDCPRERWVLKTPAHLANLRFLLAQYPDAAIVWTHRRPLAAMASFSSLTHTLRAGFSRGMDPFETGAGESRHFARVLERGMRDRSELDPARVLDVGFNAVCADPLAVVESIYCHFGFHLSDASRDRMRAYLRQHPRNRYGEHRYTPGSYGLDAGLEARLFGKYLQRFATCLDFDH